MRRLGVTCSVMAMVLAIAPAAALARHHNSRHHGPVHHTRAHHRTTHSARVRQFGSAVAPTTTSSSAADTAGTVQSFHNGVLTILLNDGSTAVAGTVNNTTKLECMSAEASPGVHADGDRGDDHSGRGDNESAANEPTEGAEPADNDNEHEVANNCSTTSLAPGATVREAELRVSSAGSIWRKVELGS